MKQEKRDFMTEKLENFSYQLQMDSREEICNIETYRDERVCEPATKVIFSCNDDHVMNTTFLRQIVQYHQNLRLLNVHCPRKIKTFQKNALTLTTHMNEYKAERLATQMINWDGPISVALHVTSLRSFYSILGKIKSEKKISDMVGLHVFVELNQTRTDYPGNILRALALHGAQTDFFLALDIDFLPGENTLSQFRQLLGRNTQVEAALRSKTVLVLPAMEFSEEGSNAVSTSNITSFIPKSKADALNMIQRREISPFHHNIFPKGHGPTNFLAWIENKTGPIYYVEYKKGFEPYVIGHREEIPDYWPMFRGFGMNKHSWFQELHVAGYSFAVLRDFFVFHLPHGETYQNESKKISFCLNYLEYNFFFCNTYHPDTFDFW